MSPTRHCGSLKLLLLAIWFCPGNGSPSVNDEIQFVREPANTPESGAVSVVDGLRAWVGLTYTADAGHSWVAMRPPPSAIDSFDLGAPPSAATTSFVTAKIGWLTGLDSVWMTRDGGVTWRRQMPGHFRMIAFVGSSGWLAADDGHSVRNYRTEDLGQTWRQCGPLWEPSEVAPWASAFFLDPKNGWMTVGSFDNRRRPYGGGVARTTDGGCTWRVLWRDDDAAENLGDIQFLDAAFGWLFASHGRLLETRDGGLHWKPLPLPTLWSIESAYLVSRTRGWAVGGAEHGSGFYMTSDGGEHWLSVSDAEVRENRGAAREIPVKWAGGFLRRLHLHQRK